MPKPLKQSVQQRLPPSQWHDQYRALEDHVLFIRLFRERNGESEAKGLVREAVEGLRTFSKETDNNFLAVVRGYLDQDIKTSNSIGETFERGTLPSLAGEANRNQREVIETAPIARTGHFAYALLDLVQQNLRILCNATLGMEYKAVTDIVLYVATTSQQSFLRLKALEVLWKIGKLEHVGVTRVENYIERALKEELRSRKLKQVVGKWPNVKQREQDMVNFKSQLEAITVFTPQYDRVHSSKTLLKGRHPRYRRTPSRHSSQHWKNFLWHP